MALDVLLQPHAQIPRYGDDYELVLELEDDGYFWFLWPFFEQLARKTGQRIDLYGDAVFGGALLDDLKQTLTAVRQSLEGRPQTWEVSVGFQMPGRQEIFSTVNKLEFKENLDKLEVAIEKAKATGFCLHFWGD